MAIANSTNYQATQFDVIVGGASNLIANITPLSAPYFLMGNGSSANVSFSTIPLYTDTTNYSFTGGF